MNRKSLALTLLVMIIGLNASTATAATFPANLHGGATEGPLLLKFWATWCVACLQEMPDYVGLYEQYGQQIEFLAVNVAVSDPHERVVAATEKYGLDMPVAYDSSGELWDQYDVIGTPTYVLLDRNGQTLYRSHRHDDELEAAMAAAVVSDRVNSDAETGDSQQESDVAKNVPVRDIDGEIVNLMPEPGEVLIGYHFAMWCASYVEDSYPELSEQCRAFDEGIRALRDAGYPGARLVGFASAYSTDESSVAKYREREDIDYPLIYDRYNAYGAAFGTRSFPHLVVIAPGGDVLYAGEQIPANLQQLIGGVVAD